MNTALSLLPVRRSTKPALVELLWATKDFLRPQRLIYTHIDPFRHQPARCLPLPLQQHLDVCVSLDYDELMNHIKLTLLRQHLR